MTLPPVLWKPSPNFWRGPSGYATRAIVNHRIVGSLESARARFMNPTSNASSHFGIGRDEANRLVIEQYVALDDSAWTNGDVRDPTWPLLLPGVNPNLYTWTIEHEDGGSANRGIVADDVWQASISLQVLLASGDPAAMRAAGINFRNDSVAEDGAGLAKDETGFIDHHQIAGPNKPHCFRRWLDDPGFVEGAPSRRDQLLTALRGLPDTATEEPMPTIIERIVGEEAVIPRIGIPLRRKPTLAQADVYYVTKVSNEQIQPYAVVEGDEYGVSGGTSTRYLAYVSNQRIHGYVPEVYATRRPIAPDTSALDNRIAGALTAVKGALQVNRTAREATNAEREALVQARNVLEG